MILYSLTFNGTPQIRNIDLKLKVRLQFVHVLNSLFHLFFKIILRPADVKRSSKDFVESIDKSSPASSIEHLVYSHNIYLQTTKGLKHICVVNWDIFGNALGASLSKKINVFSHNIIGRKDHPLKRV